MKKVYEALSVELLILAEEDVIRTSSTTEDEGGIELPDDDF